MVELCHNSATMNWVSIYGDFEAAGDAVTFQGYDTPRVIPPGEVARPEGVPETYPAYGLAICDRTFSDGEISADVTFETMDDMTGCELVFSWDAATQLEVFAGISPHRATAFEICSFAFPTPSREASRFVHRAGGSRSGLKAGGNLKLKVAVWGSRVTLSVDGVEVATASIPDLAGRRQVGIKCASRGKILIENFAVSTSKPKAFVVMEFASPFDDLYQEVIKVACEQFEVDTLRADEMYGPGIIIGDIVKQIASAQIVIADVTPKNPNVFFEVGYALALRKPIVLLARKGTPLPFDVAPFRVLFYEDSIGGKSRVSEGLTKHIAAILADGV